MSLEGAEKGEGRGEKSEIGNPLYCSYIDGVYTYRDPGTTNEFVWEEERAEWRPKRVFGTTVQYDGTSYTYADPQDGTLFEWDAQKYAWFPKSEEAGKSGGTLVGSAGSSPDHGHIHETSGFHNPNYDNSLQSNQNQPRRFYYAALSPTEMGVNEPVLFLSPDDQVNNNSTVPGDGPDEDLDDPRRPLLLNSAAVAPVQENPSSKSASGLPIGWERHEDTNGPYYWHIKSGTIQRELPSSDQVLGTAPANPALIIPGSLNSSSVRRSQTISSQLSTSGSLSSSTQFESNSSNGAPPVNSMTNNNSSAVLEKAEKRKSWSQFLENSEREREQERIRESLLRDKERPKSESSLRFVAVSLGCLSISEEDLTPERSSRAVSKVIAELTNPGHGIGSKGVSAAGIEVAGKIWGEGSELFLELDDSHLRVKTKERSLTVAEQPIHSIRVWGVGRDDPRDFAYVAREKITRQFLCHVFRLEMNARPLASALRDACKKIMIERQQKQKRPTTLPTGLRKTVTSANPSATTFFPTPMDEPRKILRAFYMGTKVVNKPTGMEVLNAAIDALRINEPIPVNVSVAPSVVMITSDEPDNPKLDEEFLARYQLSYGVTPNAEQQPSTSTSSSKTPEGAATEERSGKGGGKGQKRKLPPQPATWFEVDETQNTKVYVSNLPLDVTDGEFLELMQKCGLIMKDPSSGDTRIKLYSDSDGNKKGDGLCTYIKVESVDLALQILDGSDLRGNTIKVERAKFQMKGQYDPTKKPKSKKKKDKEKLKKQQDKLFEWQPEQLRGERPNHERVVVVQNAFLPADFDADVGLILEYQQDFREEAGKCGKCKKVTVFDRHPEGILQIFMTTPEEADAVVALFNNRFFGGKRISAFNWDGHTKYKIEETDAERDERLKNWEKFIAEEEANKPSALAASASVPVPDDEKETPPATPPDLGNDDEEDDDDED